VINMKATSIKREGSNWETPAVETLEKIMHEDKGDTSRGQRLDRMFEKTQGHLPAAAHSIVSANNGKPNLRIMTGFYIEKAGAAETDGIISAAQMTYFFKQAGIECCIVTDEHCSDVCKAALKEYGCDDLIEIVDKDNQVDTADDWNKRGVTHVIAIERPGPSFSDCIPYNMKGEPIEHCVQMHQLFRGDFVNGGRKWTTIGVIDRGNEMGSGSLPGDVVSEDIDNGSKIWCKIGADHLLVARVSNWAANALTAAVAILGDADWPEHLNLALDVNLMEKALKSMMSAGAVDGITHNNDQRFPTVDALPLKRHAEQTDLFLCAVDAAMFGRSLSEPNRKKMHRSTARSGGGKTSFPLSVAGLPKRMHARMMFG